MKKIFFALILLSFTRCISAQEVHLDIVLHSMESNETFRIGDHVPGVLNRLNDADRCIKYHLVNSRKDGKSPYVMEIWESKDFFNKYIFRDDRKRKETKEGKKVEVKYVAAGVKTKSIYSVLIRLIDRKSTAVIDMTKYVGNIDKEISVKKVRTKWKFKHSARRDLEEEIFMTYEEELEKNTSDTKTEIQNSINNLIVLLASRLIETPATIDAITKEKGDKVKEVSIIKCKDKGLANSNRHYSYEILTKEAIGGYNAYKEIGYVHSSSLGGNIYSVGKGKKEIGSIIKSGKELYVGKVDQLESRFLESIKNDDARDVDFILIFDKEHEFSDFNILNIEFAYQSYFLGNKNIRVIAYDPITESINKKWKTGIRKDGSPEIDRNMATSKQTNSIWLTISNDDMVVSKKQKLKKVLNLDTRDVNSFVSIHAEYKGMDKVYSFQKNYFIYKKSNSHELWRTKSIELKEVGDVLMDYSIPYIDFYKNEKGKVKGVYVLTNSSMSKGNKYFIYDHPEISGKSKAIGMLKIEELLNWNFGIAEFDNGKKAISKMMKANKKLYAKKRISSFLGMKKNENGSLKTYYGKSTKI